MPCCDTGRNIQKYKGSAASTLQDVTDNGNTTTGDIITTTGYFIGDGSKLTGISGASAAFTLQETSDRGNTTSNVIQFTNPITSLTTSGNVIVAGNVTASKFYGDGTTLNGVALSVDLTNNVTRISILESNLADNVTRIGNLESNLVSNASRISTLENETQPVNRGGTNITTYAKGDILIASATDTLSNLGLGQSGYVLTSNATTTLPEWRSASSIGATVAELKTGNYLAGGPFNGSSEATFDVEASNTNTADYIVARDSSGDIFVSNVNAIQYYGDGGTLSNISGSQDLQDVITIDPYTNSPPYFGAGSYGAIYGSNTINASTISTTVGFYGPIKGSNTVTASSIVSDNAVGLNRLNASNINSGTLSNTYGGTGFTSYAIGDLLVGTGSGSNLKKLPKGNANYVLTVKDDQSDIEWAPASSGGSTVWTTLGSDIYYNSGNVGIQTNTPQYELDVSGNVNITQKLLVNGTPGITGNVLGINSTSSGLEWVKAPDKVKVTANDTSTYQHQIMYSLPGLQSDGETKYIDLNSQSLDHATNDIFSFTPSESLLKVGVIRTGGNNTNNSISNLNPTHTLHVGDKIIMHNYANYDVFRVNGNVFTTGHFVGDGSYITGIKQIKNETDTDVIVAGDGAPTRRSLLSRFYN